jgi:hypothetical protein
LFIQALVVVVLGSVVLKNALLASIMTNIGIASDFEFTSMKPSFLSVSKVYLSYD